MKEDRQLMELTKEEAAIIRAYRRGLTDDEQLLRLVAKRFTQSRESERTIIEFKRP